MKMIRKIAMLLLAVCLVVPNFSLVTKAANGEIQFTDPAAKTGETFEVTCAVKTDGSVVGKVEINIAYDSAALEFVSGSGVSETQKGALKYSGEGNGSDAVIRFTMTFRALKEGSTTITVNDYSATISSGEALTCVKGYATVTIAAGETTEPEEPENPATTVPTDGLVVMGNYTVVNDIPEESIPEGFVETTVELDGTSCTFLQNEISGMYLAYLANAEGQPAFFIYHEDDATFSPFEMIEISASTYIILLADASAVTMPEGYSELDLVVNGETYPAWQSPASASNYVMYAINNKGRASLYQYDSEEGTYQRYEITEAVEEQVEEATEGDFEAFVKNNFERAVFLGIIILGILLVIIIVLGVKLRYRNLELDELYDEYEIDLEDEPKTSVPRKRDDVDEGISIDNIEKSILNASPEIKKQEQQTPTFVKEDPSFEDFDLDFIDLDD